MRVLKNRNVARIQFLSEKEAKKMRPFLTVFSVDLQTKQIPSLLGGMQLVVTPLNTRTIVTINLGFVSMAKPNQNDKNWTDILIQGQALTLDMPHRDFAALVEDAMNRNNEPMQKRKKAMKKYIVRVILVNGASYVSPVYEKYEDANEEYYKWRQDPNIAVVFWGTLDGSEFIVSARKNKWHGLS